MIYSESLQHNSVSPLSNQLWKLFLDCIT